MPSLPPEDSDVGEHYARVRGVALTVTRKIVNILLRRQYGYKQACN
jgi:hypothetical protein